MANEQYFVYDSSGNRTVQAKGDIRDQVFTIDVAKWPLLATLAKRRVHDPNPGVVQDSLASVDTDLAFAEDDPRPAATDTARSLVSNWAQLIMLTAEASAYKAAVAQWGIDNEFYYQKAKKLKEFLRSVEAILVSDQASQAPTPANDRKPKMAGISNIISTHTSASFSESNLDTMLAALVADGGNPNRIYITSAHKITMEGFTTNVTVYTDSTLHKRDDVVDVYTNAITGQDIELYWHPLLPQDVVSAGAEVLILDESLWEICEYLPLEFHPAPEQDIPGPSGTWRYALCPLTFGESGSGMFTA